MIPDGYFQKNLGILPVYCQTVFGFNSDLAVLNHSMVSVIGLELAADYECSTAVHPIRVLESWYYKGGYRK